MFDRLDSAMPFLSLSRFKLGKFLRALKACNLCHKTYWCKSTFKGPPCGFCYLCGLLTRKVRKAHLTVHFTLGVNRPGLSHQMLTLDSWESECVCLSFSTFQEWIGTRKRCVLSSSLVMSDCLLDLDVMFCCLGCLHWNVGSTHCSESVGYSQGDFHQMFC